MVVLVGWACLARVLLVCELVMWLVMKEDEHVMRKQLRDYENHIHRTWSRCADANLHSYPQAIVMSFQIYQQRSHAKTSRSAPHLEGSPARRLALLLFVVWPGSAEDCDGVSTESRWSDTGGWPWRKSAVRRLMREWIYALEALMW